MCAGLLGKGGKRGLAKGEVMAMHIEWGKLASNRGKSGYEGPKRRKAMIEQARPGDVLVFYVKSRKIGGIFKTVSEPFECNEEIFGPVKGKKFPDRVGIEPIKISEGPVSFESPFQSSALQGIASSEPLCLGGGV